MKLPEDIPAERYLLGGALCSQNVLNAILDELEDFHFSDPRNRTIFQAVKDLRNKEFEVDLSTLFHLLKSENNLNKITINYITDLQSMGYGIDSSYYIKSLLDCYCRRQIMFLSKKFMQKAAAPNESIEKVLEELQTEVFALNGNKNPSCFVIDEIIDGKHREDGKPLMTVIEERMELRRQGMSVMPGIPTPWPRLDDFIGGLVPGHLVIVGARPGVGKTTFCCNMVLDLATRLKTPVGFFSLEVSAEDIAFKLSSNVANLSYQKIVNGEVSNYEYSTHFAQAMGLMKDAKNIIIDADTNMSIGNLKSRARKMKEVYGVKAIFIDYLGFITSHQYENNKVEQISFISKELKMLAKQLNIPVVCLCQLSRASDKERRAPTQADLRDSGQIEANADEILLLHRQDAEDQNLAPGIFQIIIAKNRFGARGKLDATFDGSTGKIKIYERSISEEIKKINPEFQKFGI